MDNYNLLILKVDKEQLKFRKRFIKMIKEYQNKQVMFTFDNHFYLIKDLLDECYGKIDILRNYIDIDTYKFIELYSLYHRLNKVLGIYLDCYEDYLLKKGINELGSFIEDILGIESDYSHDLMEKLDECIVSSKIILEKIK